MLSFPLSCRVQIADARQSTLFSTAINHSRRSFISTSRERTRGEHVYENCCAHGGGHEICFWVNPFFASVDNVPAQGICAERDRQTSSVGVCPPLVRAQHNIAPVSANVFRITPVPHTNITYTIVVRQQ